MIIKEPFTGELISVLKAELIFTQYAQTKAPKWGVQKVYTLPPDNEPTYKTDVDISAFLTNEHIRLSWREMAKKYGISCGTLDAYAHGRPVKNQKHRKALGLSPLALAPACPECGEVHTKKRCDKKKNDDKPKPPLTPKEQRAKAVASLQRAINKAAKLELDPWWNTELADMQSCLERIKS